MRFFYDTEFVEDGVTIDLVSIGIVADDGREFYGVSSEFDVDKLLANPWLVENVWPHLPQRDGKLDTDHASVHTRVELARKVHEFLTPPVWFGPKVELWADYAAYDHVALAQLFGTMMDLPPGLPMFTHDVQQMASAAGWTFASEENAGAHNALVDAHQCRARWTQLAGMLRA